MKPLLALLALVILAAPVGAEPPPANVLVDVQMVSLPRIEGQALAAKFLDAAKAEAAYAELQKLIGAGTAKLLGWPMIITQSGRRAQFEAVHEIRYVSEVEPGGIYVEVLNENGTITLPKNVRTAADVHATPSSFETRNAGLTLEVEPVVLDDGKRIDLNLVPQHVHFRGMKPNRVVVEHSGRKEEAVVDQPVFQTMKAQTSLTLKNDGRALLGIFPTDEPPDHVELFILHAVIREP